MATNPDAEKTNSKPSTRETPRTVHQREKCWTLGTDIGLLEMRLRDQSSSMLEFRKWPAKKPTKEPKFTCKVRSERFNNRAKSNRHQRMPIPTILLNPSLLCVVNLGVRIKLRASLRSTRRGILLIIRVWIRRVRERVLRLLGGNSFHE